jgi:hypothetical protein
MELPAASAAVPWLTVLRLDLHVFVLQACPRQELVRCLGGNHAKPSLAERRPGQLAGQVLSVVRVKVVETC